MSSSDSTTRLWIIIWGVVAIVCGLTFTIWGAIVSTIAVLLIAVSLFFNSRWGKTIYRKIMLRNPFEAWYGESVEKPIISSCIINTSGDPQHLRFTLCMKNELDISFIQLAFVGEGKTPKIKSLYDWLRAIPSKPEDVECYEMQDGSWYWRYHSPWPRFAGARVTIGIKCLATDSFDGELQFRLTAIQVPKGISVPFIVKR